jgi:hypothetical protein
MCTSEAYLNIILVKGNVTRNKEQWQVDLCLLVNIPLDNQLGVYSIDKQTPKYLEIPETHEFALDISFAVVESG